MSTLICQRRNSDKTVLAVEILAPMEIDHKIYGKHKAVPGQYMIRDDQEVYFITQKEFEDTYFIRREI